jgi:hypothetical protein
MSSSIGVYYCKLALLMIQAVRVKPHANEANVAKRTSRISTV